MIEVKPIWGWGWSDSATRSTIEPPEPFCLATASDFDEGNAPGVLVGRVLPGHALAASYVMLNLRHTSADESAYTAFISRREITFTVEGDPIADLTGFVLIAKCA